MLDLSFDGHSLALLTVLGYSLVGWGIPLGIKLNYGKLKQSFFAFEFSPKLAWFLMEIPNLLWALYFLLVRGDDLSLGYALFIAHYINRTIIYPLRMKTQNRVPIEIVASAGSFTLANGYLQGLCNIREQSGEPFNLALRVVGVVVFAVGMLVNIKSDNILQAAKEKAASAKKNDNGGKSHGYVAINEFLFKYVANPNYFGEIVEWLGYFLVCQKLQAFMFFFSTLNILTAAAIPRSRWNK